MRSVHTAGSAQENLSRTSPLCLELPPTNVGFISFVMAFRIYLPSTLCSTPITVHQRSYDASDSRWGLVPTGSPSFLYTTFPPFHPQPPYDPRHRFYTLPLSVTGFLVVYRHGLNFAHSLAGSLAPYGRNGFVNLRTGGSLSVASHPTLQ